ncbi:hypothetical protein R6Q59_036112 [Mikania micrantha]
MNPGITVGNTAGLLIIISRALMIAGSIAMSPQSSTARGGLWLARRWRLFWCLCMRVEKREIGYGGVLLQLNSYSPEAILLRFIIMLKFTKNFVLDIPFFNMKAIKLHIFLVIIGILCSIIRVLINFLIR